MRSDKYKKRLFRKVNTRARGIHHTFGGDYKYSRNSKNETREQIKGSMHGTKHRGLDYTPLFKFLLSKVGKSWDEVYSEAKSRLDKPDPIFWLVSKKVTDKKDYVRVGESSYYSGMYIDNLGTLQLSNPKLKATDLKPACTCCTHTLNGLPFGTIEKDQTIK